jgi:acyl-CoA thioester hydrolase
MTAELPWDVRAPFVEPMTVTPADTDQMGHTNNVVYLSWLERVAWAHSQSLGLDFDAYERLGTGCVARRHELDYLAATFAGEQLMLGTWIAENAGRVDMWRAYQIIRVADAKTVLRGRTHWICIDLKSGKPKRQPAEFVQAYKPIDTQQASAGR